MIDLGVIVTASAAGLAVWRNRRCNASWLLLMAWAASMLSALVLPKGLLPGSWAIIDLCIASACLLPWTRTRCQIARIVGMISMAMIPAHFGFAASAGKGSWTLYASILNAGFVLQCSVAAGGWRVVENIVDRLRLRIGRRRVDTDRGGA